ncbi:MAG: ABC transporter substrate-binding protein [Intestinibacillus sp.]
MLKKFAALFLAALTMAAALTGCGSAAKQDGAADASQDQTQESRTVAKKDMYIIGLLQFAEHPSLDNCRKGFIEGLAEAGFTEGENVRFEYKNAQADNSINQQIATQFVSSKVDMIGAVATNSAQAAFNAAEPAGIPVVYVAVSDPVGAQLTGKDGKSGKAVTGVSDLIPAEKQLELIRAFLPNAKKIGILYSTSEPNSKAQLQLYKDAAPQYGFEIVESGISSTADVATAADALAAKVDCFTNLTDNTVVSALPTLLDKADKAKIPVFGSEVEQVKNGCLASEGIDYVALGKQAGKMAARVLNGEDITGIPFETVTDYSADVNTTTLKKLGLTMPDEIGKTATLHE